MSIQSEINRIKGNVAGAYAAVSDMGGTLPDTQVSTNLADAIRSIPSGGGDSGPPDPEEVYSSARPAGWLPMPTPADNEIYLLFHIPDGVSGLLAFTVTCTGSYTVAIGTVADGQFVQQSERSVPSGTKYEAELLADNFGDLTSTGMKQAMIKISGTDILSWEPSAHSKKTYPYSFCGWNIMEIACRLSRGEAVRCGSSNAVSALVKMYYFNWFGGNCAADMTGMFRNCRNLRAVLQLDTSAAANMSYMFSECRNLCAVPQFDTSHVTNMSYMFNSCQALRAVPQLDSSHVTDMRYMFYSCGGLSTIPPLDTSAVTNMTGMFDYCQALRAVPQLDTSHVTDMPYMFGHCGSLSTIPQLDTSRARVMTNMFNDCYGLCKVPQLDTSCVEYMSNIFYNCYSINSVLFNPDVTGWEGYEISVSDASLGHEALVDLFNSLPAITASKALVITRNPGVAELTSAEKAIATGKNWTLQT